MRCERFYLKKKKTSRQKQTLTDLKKQLNLIRFGRIEKARMIKEYVCNTCIALFHNFLCIHMYS